MIEATVTWKSRAEGGRREPPTGPVYSATAVVRRDDDDYDPLDHFSIVLQFDDPPAPSSPHRVRLDFLAPELVLPTLEVGEELLVMEGPRAVAVCRVDAITGR